MSARPGFIFVCGIGFPEEDYLHGLDAAEQLFGLDAVNAALAADREQAIRHICLLVDDLFGGEESKQALRRLALRGAKLSAPIHTTYPHLKLPPVGGAT